MTDKSQPELQVRYYIRSHVTAFIVCMLIVFPIVWEVGDRTPPHVRERGTVSAHDQPGKMPHVGEEFDITWQTSPQIRSCLGYVQSEIIDAENNIHIKNVRDAFVSSLGSTVLKPKPWTVPSDAKPGPAIYRVTTFWYCTWFERLFDWPVVQVGPDVKFTILPLERKSSS